MENDRNALYVELLASHEKRLRYYCQTLVPDMNSADEVYQESIIAIWKNFDAFEEGTNFSAWAHRIIFNRVLAFRKTRKRENEKYTLSDDFYELISEVAISEENKADGKIDALMACVDNLPAKHRSLMRLKYFDNVSIEDVAKELNKTVDAAYRSISRVRMRLKDCMDRTWSMGRPT